MEEVLTVFLFAVIAFVLTMLVLQLAKYKKRASGCCGGHVHDQAHHEHACETCQCDGKQEVSHEI